MEIAIALGLPTGRYKVNHDNLSLLRVPVKPVPRDSMKESSNPSKDSNVDPNKLFGGQMDESKENSSFQADTWNDRKAEEKKLDDNAFWMEDKANGGDSWQEPADVTSVKTLATKFEPNLSTKLLESSNDSIDDTKYEEPVQLIDLDSNSKDIEHSNSSENLDESPEISIEKDHAGSIDGKTNENENIEKDSSRLWGARSGNDKVSPELWNENSNITPLSEKAPPQLWSENSNIAEKQELWNENSNIQTNEKTPPRLWNENSTNEKVDETNSEFLDTFLSVQNSTEFLGNENSGFLTDNMSLMNDKSDKTEEETSKTAKKSEWREERNENFMRMWDSGKSSDWVKDDAEILSESLHERMPGLRTTNRLTSTPETNGNITFNIPNRRNSISDFSNINLESSSLDMVLPPAKTLIKERTKDPKGNFEIKDNSNFLEASDNFKMKNWASENGKTDFSTSNVNSEDLMKMALESLTSQHDVINVPATSFDSAMGILNPSQETGNLNLFTSSETDGLDFNLPLPEHLLRTNFTTNNSFTNTNYQTTCTSNFSNSVSPTFMSTTNNLFGTTSTISNSIKFDQFEETNFPPKKSKLDDVMEFFDDSKNTFNSYNNCNITETNNMTNFSSFVSASSASSHNDQYSVTQCLNDSVVSAFVPENEQQSKKKVKTRLKKVSNKKNPVVRNQKVKKVKNKKIVDYPKSSSIESIINEALFESCVPQCASSSKSLQIENSSPSGRNAIPNGTDNYTLPIIPESLDEVGNLDFLNQD